MATSPNYSWPEPDNTDLVKNGALAMRTLGNAIDTTMATMTPKSTVTAKGSLIAATAASTPANLSVGNNGETLVADSSTATGLRYQGSTTAGKNVIINGNFGIWQRGTSFVNPSVNAYTADRWLVVTNHTGGTVTMSRQAFTGTDMPVAGAQYYFRTVGASPTGQTFYTINQKIENVQTLAGQTVTLSFYAKADAARNITPALYQLFGSGGSSATTTTGSAIALTTSWARYSQTFSIPSISGKTIGTDSYLQLEFTLPNNVASSTIEFYGVQIEAGSVATPFQTATGTIQGELAACQRYYWRYGADATYLYAGFGLGSASSTTRASINIQNPVPMRTNPSAIDYATTALTDGVNAVSAVTAISFAQINPYQSVVLADVASGLTQYRLYRLCSNNSANGYFGLSAEL